MHHQALGVQRMRDAAFWHDMKVIGTGSAPGALHNEAQGRELAGAVADERLVVDAAARPVELALQEEQQGHALCLFAVVICIRMLVSDDIDQG